jgi:hypothetical protein
VQKGAGPLLVSVGTMITEAGGDGGQGFDLADITEIVGCPVLASCARAGTMLPMAYF